MIGLLQRVTRASVEIAADRVAQIDRGLLVFVGIVPADTADSAQRLLERLLKYRIFPDAVGKLNLSLSDIQGGLLLVPQFTLAADTSSGLRPGFSTAAPPAQAQPLFEGLVAAAQGRCRHLAAGRFGADMQVSLTNDGPITFWLES